MKKKLIIAAAIAFAVFAVPYGSSALSTVSVASENNTVVAPSTKPVEEVKNAVDAIDASKITDAASADNAAVALIKIGSQDLKEAMNAGQDTVNDVAAIEAAYKKAKGIKDTTLANSGAVKAVGIVGAAFVAPDTTLSVEAPAATPEITSSTYAVTSTPVYVEISLKAGTYSVESLPIPVAVTIETPAGVDGNKAVIFHFVNGGLEEIKPIYNASANTLTFTVYSLPSKVYSNSRATVCFLYRACMISLGRALMFLSLLILTVAPSLALAISLATLSRYLPNALSVPSAVAVLLASAIAKVEK